MNVAAVVAENLQSVQERVAEAAVRSGRSPDEVRLVAVTKYVSSDVIRHLVTAGCKDLGESRPQALWQKDAELADLPIRWHLVGHLQTNKVRRTLKLERLVCIQSVDRVELLERLEAEAGKLERSVDILLEARVSSDPTKHGFARSELPAAIGMAQRCQFVRLRGLMTMASLEADADQTRQEFTALRQWRDELAEELGAEEELRELSMGMSRDFEIAIECGATIVRVGSALFRGLSL